MKIRTFFPALILASVLAGPALADATVKVELWDKGGMMDMSKHMGFAMGMHGDMGMAIMGIKTDVTEVPAGNVTFAVTNVSKDTLHEMLVSPIKSLDDELPYIEDQNRVDEENSGDLGEVSELDPGKSGALTLDLKPGLYLLYCNVPGHYAAGMWTVVKVI
jgi:uncharacterized cupredoxin-like copper-binding protein